MHLFSEMLLYKCTDFILGANQTVCKQVCLKSHCCFQSCNMDDPEGLSFKNLRLRNDHCCICMDFVTWIDSS